jgi:hypothetical protein
MFALCCVAMEVIAIRFNSVIVPLCWCINFAEFVQYVCIFIYELNLTNDTALN